jgi:ABC-2 type transport system ATP-binding protein
VEPVIVAEKLSKRFGQIQAVNGVDLEVQPGEVFGLLGPNGSGKTTLIRMLCGLLQPASGRGIVGGFDITRDPERVKRSIGYVSQRFSLYPDLTVEENIHFFADVYGVDALEASRSKRDLVRVCGLAGREHQQAGRLSGGFKQRLALACALIHHPKIVFLDEPTAGVDPVARRMMWDLLFQLDRRGPRCRVGALGVSNPRGHPRDHDPQGGRQGRSRRMNASCTYARRSFRDARHLPASCACSRGAYGSDSARARVQRQGHSSTARQAGRLMARRTIVIELRGRSAKHTHRTARYGRQKCDKMLRTNKEGP